AASDSRRRLWLACLEAAASRRSSSVEKSALTVTAVAMARILPRHGISSTSRGKSPASQNGRPLVLLLAQYCRHAESAHRIARSIDSFDDVWLTTEDGLSRFERLS